MEMNEGIDSVEFMRLFRECEPETQQKIFKEVKLCSDEKFYKTYQGIKKLMS